MPTTLPVLFLAFANSATDPLPQLSEEENQIRRSLLPRAEQHYHIHPDSHASVNSIRQYLTDYRNQVWLFHYAGHAGSKQIMLSSGEAQADGVAAMLAEQASLKLVFLNGCSTQAQVQKLLELGIPAVIATSAPIDDLLARRFSGYFYDALMAGASIGQAFQSAANFVSASGRPQPQLRNLFTEKTTKAEDAEWGLFHHPDRAEVLDERLPSGMREEVPDSFVPNQLLIQNIYQALIEEEVLTPSRRPPKLSRQRMAILNNLPAPIAEHLRKLFVPLGDSDEGYDKIGPSRLRQLNATYQVLMELMCFTLLAQLWEESLQKKPVSLEAKVKAQILDFLQQPANQRQSFHFIPFIRSLRQALDAAKIKYFVDELSRMSQLIAEDSAFRRGCSHFDFLQQRLIQENDTQLQAEVGKLCVEAEKQLAAIFAELGYLGRYTLATVKQILVKKHRHREKAHFEHLVVRLVDLLGGMDQEDETFTNFLDSQSVVLLKEIDEEEESSASQADEEKAKEESKKMDYLSLSPFVIDENAFIDSSDVSKIYFYHHRQRHPDAWAYHWAYKPTDPPLLVPGKNFAWIEEQIEAFLNSLQANTPS
ncbi:MAG: CHAT domain-containing protein [Bacteroidota bacterium]